MEFTKRGVLLVLLSLTLVTTAPPPPRDVTRTALVGRLGLTIAAQTITDIATSRNQKTPLERIGNPASRTPSISQVPNYRATPDPSSGQIRGYFLIPLGSIHDVLTALTHDGTARAPSVSQVPNYRATPDPPSGQIRGYFLTPLVSIHNVLTPLTRDGRPLSHTELESLLRNRGILENFAPNITQFFPILPIEINVPDMITTLVRWFNSIPFINSWQQGQKNQTKIYFTPSTLYLKPHIKATYNGLSPVTGVRESSGFVVGTHILPVQLVSRRNVMDVMGNSKSNYFRILNEYLRVYKKQQQTDGKLPI